MTQTALRFGVTRSAEEALDVLRKHRAEMISAGRAFAIEHAQRYGEVTSRDVAAALESSGMLRDYSGSLAFLGAVFVGGPFRNTGRVVPYVDAIRNSHRKFVCVWELDLTNHAQKEHTP